MRIRHYDPVEYYDRLIEMHEVIASTEMLRRRLLFRSRPAIRLIHALRTFAARRELAEFRRLRELLMTDQVFRAFHEGRSEGLPEFYHRRLDQRLGRLAALFPPHERTPILDGWPPRATESVPRKEAALPRTIGSIGDSRPRTTRNMAGRQATPAQGAKNHSPSVTNHTD
jgi:hypothetical protein